MMEKSKEINELLTAADVVTPEMLSAKVAKIVSKTVEACNVLLLPLGCRLDLKVEFYSLDKKDEAKNG